MNSATPGRADQKAFGASSAIGTAGVKNSGVAERISTTAVAPNAISGPTVTKAQPVSSGAAIPTRAAMASRAPI